MTTRTAGRTMEEICELGLDAYDRFVKPHVRPEDDGLFVVIDVDTGEYEIGANSATVGQRMVAQKPNADRFMTRVNRRAAFKFGGGR